jgi:hypothetical protein
MAKIRIARIYKKLQIFVKSGKVQCRNVKYNRYETRAGHLQKIRVRYL